jgi:hypothetical protein
MQLSGSGHANRTKEIFFLLCRQSLQVKRGLDFDVLPHGAIPRKRSMKSG